MHKYTFTKKKESPKQLPVKSNIPVELLQKYFHDFGHLLHSPLIGIDQLVRENTSANEKRRKELLNRIRDDMKLVVKGHDQFRQLFLGLPIKLKSGNTETAAVSEIVGDLVITTNPFCKKREIELAVSLQGNDFQVPKNFDLVLFNLLMNAIDSYDGVKRTKRPIVKIFTKCVDNSLLICVEDSGRGIDHTDLERVCDLGYSTKTTGEGLGLYLAKTILDQSGALLTIRSLLGQGTQVEVLLPAAGINAK